MPDFETMFAQSKGQPVAYEGKTLYLTDFFPTEGSTQFRLVIETCNGKPATGGAASLGSRRTTRSSRSRDGLAPWRDLKPAGEWRQGVMIRLVHPRLDGKWGIGATDAAAGHVIVRGEVLDGTKGLVFWHTDDSDSLDFGVVGDATTLQVVNVWDRGNGMIDYMHNGAAMLVASVPDGRRYSCNDGIADDDFDDIVFRLQRLPE